MTSQKVHQKLYLTEYNDISAATNKFGKMGIPLIDNYGLIFVARGISEHQTVTTLCHVLKILRRMLTGVLQKGHSVKVLEHTSQN